MKIYCAHSSSFDYEHDWYDVLRKSPIMEQHTCIFPHETPEIEKNSYPVLQSVDCVLAEVSHNSTGMGIELGWAHALGKPICCFYTVDTKPSLSLQAITSHCLKYDSPEELLTLITHFLSHEMNHSE